MRLIIYPSTIGTGGGGLRGELKNFDYFIQEELQEAGFESSFDELRVELRYPPMYVYRGNAYLVPAFWEDYETLPVSRIFRRTKYIEVRCKAPEFSEHFHKDEWIKYKSKIQIEEKYKDLDPVTLAHLVIDKCKEAVSIIQKKLKKDDQFDCAFLEHILESVRKKISAAFLKHLSVDQEDKKLQANLDQVEETRMEREGAALPKDTLIRDIRLSFKYELPQKMFYLRRFENIVLKNLIEKDFRCPRYHHLYISIGNTKEEALQNAFALETWHTYGVAVLKKDILFNASPAEQQDLVLNALREGLMDIATMDGLDTDKILDAVTEARKLGATGELIFKTKENNRIAFIISTKAIVGQNRDEIYFTIIDKQTGRVAKWKFGQENIFMIGGWFGTINVTNKKITTKPRAHMDLVLKDKEKSIVIDVEAALNDPAKTKPVA